MKASPESHADVEEVAGGQAEAHAALDAKMR